MCGGNDSSGDEGGGGAAGFGWLTIVDETLRSGFYRLGEAIGKEPGYFLIVPLLLTALCGTGFQRIVHEADPEYLFSPLDGEAKLERHALEFYFPTNYTDFDPSRASRFGRGGRLLVTARDNGSIVRKEIFDEIAYLDFLVHNISIEWKGQRLQYGDICSTWRGKCWKNEILLLARHISEIERGEVPLTYPFWFDLDTFDRVTFPLVAGGIELSEDRTIESIYVASLSYFVRSQNREDLDLGAKWEDAFLRAAASVPLRHIAVARCSSLTLEMELEANTKSVVPYFSLNIGIMVGFCVLTCMMTDWVKSKPLLGLLGVLSSVQACIAAFGFVMYWGMRFSGITLAVPFLMLGIGIDDTFVMIGAWRRTSPLLSVPERMGHTFKDAAVSITITSLTDTLSFCIGIITSFPCVQIFCVYSAAAVAFTYLWHITFFGACMALSGYAEKNNRHALTCRKVVPKSESGNYGLLYNAFCSGGINPKDPANPKDNRENCVMAFFRDYFAAVLNNSYARGAILVGFFIYLSVAIWGVLQLQEGLERRRLARFDSYSVRFYDLEDRYFREYPYRISVVFSGSLNYSSPKTQSDIESIMQRFEKSPYIDPTFTECWLRDFLDFIHRNEEYAPIDVSDEYKFIEELTQTYLSSGDTHFTSDISLGAPDSGGFRRIEASRFLVQGHQIYNTEDEKQLLKEVREICHTTPYNVTVFNPYFIYFDQFLIVMPTTIQCVAVAAICMMIVSLIMIPNPICSLWVAFSIVSIEIGVVGFMTLWGVNLDSISMINLIMCIGFSVDFSAHISYHFMSRRNMSIENRVRDSMFALGLPISQGALSTILGVLGLYLSPSYIFVTFFKMVFLVIVLGALHGLLLLPVLLSLFGPGSCESKLGGRPKRADEATKLGKSGSPAVTDADAWDGTALSLSCRHNVVPRRHLPDAAAAAEPLDYQMSTIEESSREMRRHLAVAASAAAPPPDLRIPRPSTKLSSPAPPPSGKIATALSTAVGPGGSGRSSIQGGSENSGYVDPDNV